MKRIASRLWQTHIIATLATLLLVACFADRDEASIGTSDATPAGPTAPGAPATDPDNCSVPLQEVIDSAIPGAVLDLRGCTYETRGTTRIEKPLTLLGGALRSTAESPWEHTLSISSHGVTIEGWEFVGGGVVVAIVDQANVRVRNNSFRDHIGISIAMWGAVREIRIEGNDIVNSKTRQSSIMIGRGSEGSNPCPVVGKDVVIRGNVADQGPGRADEASTVGWFGIELKCFEDVLIEGNRLKGGHALISLPDSNRVTVRDNLLDLRGFAFWGVEIAKAHDVRIEFNTVIGDGKDGNDTAFSANSGSERMMIRYNAVHDVRTLVDDPYKSWVTDNCLNNVLNVSEYGDPSTSIVAHNEAC